MSDRNLGVGQRARKTNFGTIMHGMHHGKHVMSVLLVSLILMIVIVVILLLGLISAFGKRNVPKGPGNIVVENLSIMLPGSVGAFCEATSRLQPYGPGIKARMYKLTCATTLPLLLKCSSRIHALDSSASTPVVFIASGALYLCIIFRAMFPKRDVRLVEKHDSSCLTNCIVIDGQRAYAMGDGNRLMLPDLMQGETLECDWSTLLLEPFGSCREGRYDAITHVRGAAVAVCRAIHSAARLLSDTAGLVSSADVASDFNIHLLNRNLKELERMCHLLRRRPIHNGVSETEKEREWFLRSIDPIGLKSEPEIPPAYILCGREDRRLHMTQLMSHIGINRVHFVAPEHPGDKTMATLKNLFKCDKVPFGN